MKEKSKKRHYFLRSLTYLKPYKGYTTLTILSCVCAAAAATLIPVFTEKTLTAFTNSNSSALLISAALLLAVELFQSVIHMLLWGTSATRLKAKVTKDIRFNTIQSIMRMKIKNFDLYGTGKILQVVSNDTANLANIYTQIIDVFMSIIAKVAIFVYIFVANYLLGIYCLLEFVIVSFVYHFRVSTRIKDHRKMKKKQDENIGLIAETVRGVREIKNYNIRPSILEKNDKSLHELERIDEKFSCKQYQLYRVTQITKSVTKFLFIPVALLLIHFNLATFAVAFTIFVFRNDAVSIIDWAMNTWEYVKDGGLYAERIFNIIDGWQEGFENFPEKDNFKKLSKTPNVEIKDLTFSYNGTEKVLKNFSLQIPHGKKIAIVGASGEGKSTVLKLLNKTYEVERGKIFIGGHDINDFSENTLRSTVTIVPQDPYIFNFSILENLMLFNPDATRKQIETACKKAQIYDFIMDQPDGFDTVLGEDGTRLSGGQKQRLAIARAFLNKSPILIFDETTSALDNENQSKIKEVIDNIGRDKIVIIVAHRLSTIIDSDEICFMKGGKIKTSGTHQELLKNCKEYQNLYKRESVLSKIGE